MSEMNDPIAGLAFDEPETGDGLCRAPVGGSAELFVQSERWTADRWKVMFKVGMLKFAIGADCTDKQQAERLRDDFADALSQLGINLPNEPSEPTLD